MSTQEQTASTPAEEAVAALIDLIDISPASCFEQSGDNLVTLWNCFEEAEQEFGECQSFEITISLSGAGNNSEGGDGDDETDTFVIACADAKSAAEEATRAKRGRKECDAATSGCERVAKFGFVFANAAPAADYAVTVRGVKADGTRSASARVLLTTDVPSCGQSGGGGGGCVVA